MNSFKKLGVVFVVTLLMVSCNDFGSINTDPNNPSAVKTELLLTNALRSISGPLAAVDPVLYVQHMSETQYNESSRYQGVNYDFSGYYTGPLRDLETIIELNTNDETKASVTTGGSNNNQIAVARIMKAYFYQLMTDRWGYLPYSEALEGSDNFTPAYDSQESIYMDLITELKEAVDQMDNGGDVSAGDFILGGDMDRWAEFANSLRARIALRMSGVSGMAATAKAEFEDAISDGVITADVWYPYLSSSDNQNPWYARFITRTDYAISDVLADTLKALGDMRATAFADPAPDTSNANGSTELFEVIGLDYGLENPGEVTNDEVSFPGQALRAQNAPLAIITVAEMQLAMAEAAENGWTTPGTAATHYANGIAASWDQWGVTGDGTALTAYMANPEVVYAGGAAGMDQIAYEKWVALYGNGYEAWSEWRRLDHPQLTPHPFPLNQSGEIPVRHGYPTSEAQLNSASYEAAVSAQGTDDTTTNLWWDN